MIANLPPYPAMKDSGVPWLGSVPQHWELRRTKTVLSQRSEKGHPDEPLLAATQAKGVIRKDEYDTRTVLALKDLQLLKLVRIGDFVISLRSFQGGIEFARHQGIISPAYTILHPVDKDHHGYLSYLFKSLPYIEGLSFFVTGIRQGKNIDYGKLSRSILPLPPLSEQIGIVRFLHHFDQRIQRYIRAKQKLIALLEEQEQAIVHQAVTGQIDVMTGNPYPSYRDSGVEWLEAVPEHWEVTRIKTEFRCLNHRRLPLSGTTRGEMSLRRYDYYGASGVIDKVEQYLFDDELLLIAEDGANLVLRSLPLAIIARGKFWVNNHAHILKPKRGNIEFLASAMESLNYLPWISGAAQPKLTQDRLMSIVIAVPSREEQDRIVSTLATVKSRIRIGISRAKREISLLREYRSRQIADVVTGKLDVQEAVAELPGEDINDSPGGLAEVCTFEK